MRKFLPFLLLITLASCAGAPKAATTGPLIALLPAANESLDVEAPAKVRAVLAKLLAERGFRIVDAKVVDDTLKDKHGVTDGGQLRIVTMEQLKATLPGERWFFPTVKEYNFKSAAALSQRKVVLALKVVDAATGKIIYLGEETGITTRAGVDAAGDLALNVAGKVLRSLTPGKPDVADTDLTQEAREAATKLLANIPK